MSETPLDRPPESPESPDAAASPPAAPTPSRAGLVLRSVGSVIAGAAKGAAQGASAAWHAVDPDLRRPLGELPLLGLTMLQSRRPPPVRLPDDGHRPLVFVHGLGGHRGNFLPMRLFFRLQGRTRTYSVGFEPHAGLDQLAAQLGAYLDEVARVNGLGESGQVDLVAHSMGGIVARLALEDLSVRSRVRTLLTLGTPHAGTHAARYAATAFTLALRPGSEVLERLAQQAPWTAPPRLVCFWSRSDVLLLPPETACVQGAECVELAGLTHYGYLLQPACFRRAFEALREERER